MTSERQVDFFFELASPYSYLAATQVEALEQRSGVPFVWQPMVLGAVFKEVGITLPASIPAKARYMLTDLKRWAAHYDVPFRWPSRFPMHTITAQRLILAAEQRFDAARARQLTLALYRAYWASDLDISDATTLAEVATSLDLPASELLEMTQDAAIKDRLKASTERAVAAGVFGAPSFVHQGELYWGNDRLDLLEAALSGP